MIQATCIQKFKKNNKIYGYRLQDSQGRIQDIYADQLKQAIETKQIKVINLTLTSDNRLVDTTSNQQPTKSHEPKTSEGQIQDMLTKAKMLGLPIKEIRTYCGHKCILISKSETQHILYIPDNVTRLNNDHDKLTFTKHIQALQGSIKVIGGHNINNVEAMFYRCQAQSLDLSSFNTSKVTNMAYMFGHCNAQSLDLSSLDTRNVTDMKWMFFNCKAQSINMSSFNTSKVTNLGYMFGKCQTQSLDLSSFDTSQVTDMTQMFAECQSKYIDISSFNASKVTNMWCMLYNCKAQIKATDPKILEAYKNK